MGENAVRNRPTTRTILLGVAAVAAFLSLAIGNARDAKAWSLSSSLMAFSVAIIGTGVLVAVVGRPTVDRLLSQFASTSLLWNLAIWLPVPSLRLLALVAVPILMVVVSAVVSRPGTRRGEEARLRPDVPLIKAVAWHTLLSLVVFLAVAWGFNHYGIVASR